MAMLQVLEMLQFLMAIRVNGGSSSNKQFGIDFDKSMSDDWTLNASLESAQSSNSGYNNTVEFSTRMSF